jgi:hypothetical protein
MTRSMQQNRKESYLENLKLKAVTTTDHIDKGKLKAREQIIFF